MLNAGDLAALIAAFFWAVLVCAGVYMLFRLARLLSEAARLLAELRSRSDLVFERVQAAVDRANEQLDATSSVTASLDELNAGMSELAGQVSALAGLGRMIAAGPAGRAAALVYGVRRAVAIRRHAPGPDLPPMRDVPTAPDVPGAARRAIGNSRDPLTGTRR
jgi:hypothetical protein